MKKCLWVIVMASLALALSLPALAVDVDFSGEYRIRGFYNDNPTLQDDGDKDSAAWLDHRFRLETKFKANENVSLTTRLDVFDEQPFGEEDVFFDNFEQDDSQDIDVDAVYLTVLSPIGLFKAGRIPGGSTFGTSLGNTGVDYAFDRIEYFAKSGNLIFGALYEKLAEDNVLGDVDNEGDCDSYYLLGVYHTDTLEAGLAFRYQDADEVADLVDNGSTRELVAGFNQVAASMGFNPFYIPSFLPPGVVVPQAPVLSAVAGIYYNYGKVANYAFNPYIKAAITDCLKIEAEAIYETGEYEADNRTLFLNNTLTPVNFGDRDIDSLTYKVEAMYESDAASFNLGWASTSGQDFDELMKPDGDITIGNLIYRGLGDDFTPLLILTGDAGGKPLNNGYTTMLSGADLLYAGASFPLNDKLTLHGAIGQAWANEDEYTGGDDDLGFEVDLGVTWKAMDNLCCKLVAGYLDEGDEILAGTMLLPGSGDGDATYAVYSEVTMTF